MKAVAIDWIRSKTGFRLLLTVSALLLLSICYMLYISQWLSGEFEALCGGGGAGISLEQTVERITIRFVSTTFLFLAGGVIVVTVFSLSGGRADADAADTLALQDDDDEDDEDPIIEMEEDLMLPAEMDDSEGGEEGGAVPGAETMASAPSNLAHSYTRMLDVMQRINEMEKEHSIELADKNTQLQQEIAERKRAEAEIRHLSNRLISGIEEARKHLAQDLHDEFGQTLTALHIEAETLMSAMPADLVAQRQRIDGLVALIEQLGDKIRSISSDLRPDLLDDLGLVPTLRWNIEEYARNRPELQIDFQAVGARKRFPSDIELVLYRLFQESLNNVIKHSRATRFSVTLTYSHPKIIFILKDNGIGFDQNTDTDGIGLLGMRERVVSVAGTIAIISGKGRGTTIRVELPVSREGLSREN